MGFIKHFSDDMPCTISDREPIKVLNLYCGVGGNRKLWGDDYDITAVEIDEKIANVYKSLYPNDTVIVGDAHEYLLAHSHEFDFIWSSPPCPTHSVTNHFLNAQGHKRYPDMGLWQEIIYLQTFFDGDYVVENVKSYYTPLIPPQISGRHYFWSNLEIPNIPSPKIGRMDKLKDGTRGDKRVHLDALGIDLNGFKVPNKDKLLRNCVSPDIGKAIIDLI